MTADQIHRDERTTAVEHASYRLAYLVLSYGLLAAVAYRSFARGESAWDLLALVVLGGAVSTVYQARHQVLGRRWVQVTLASIVAALIIGALAALLGVRS